jgi:Uncharacterized conserved protein (DUF2181)
MSFTWSHSTNSRTKLTQALADPLVDAIEADILMGRDTTNVSSSAGENITPISSPTTNIEPIMGHPPHHESDLSVSTFLKMVTGNTVEDMDASAVGKQHRPHVTLQKHIKLDFKEIETIQPTLTQLQNLLHPKDGASDGSIPTTSSLRKTVFLNADILPGPGRRDVEHMSSSAFLDACLAHIAQTKVHFASAVRMGQYTLDTLHATSHTYPYFCCSLFDSTN